MTRPSNAPRQPPKKQRHIKRFALLVVTGIVVVFLVGWAGWGIHAATHPAKQVRVSKVFTGTISLVGNGGSSGCVKPSSGGPPVCTGFYQEAGAPALKVGQKVHAAEEWADNGSGSGNLLLIYSPDS